MRIIWKWTTAVTFPLFDFFSNMKKCGKWRLIEIFKWYSHEIPDGIGELKVEGIQRMISNLGEWPWHRKNPKRTKMKFPGLNINFIQFLYSFYQYSNPQVHCCCSISCWLSPQCSLSILLYYTFALAEWISKLCIFVNNTTCCCYRVYVAFQFQMNTSMSWIFTTDI